MIRNFFIPVTFILLISLSIQVRALDESVEEEIQLVISDQITAFKNLDVDKAYAHASLSIKSIFPNATIFGSMVKNSYPMIWDPKEYQFLELKNEAGVFTQRVIFTDNLDRIFLFDYVMEYLNDKYFINGVYPINRGEGV